MSSARQGHTATSLGNGSVLLAGGNSGGTGTADLFNFSSGTFSPPIAMTAMRKQHSATLLGDGRALIAGGNISGLASNSVEFFDPVSASFKTSPRKMVSTRQNQATTILPGGEVLLAGGIDDTATYIGTAERYQPIGIAISEISRLPNSHIQLQGKADPGAHVSILTSPDLITPFQGIDTTTANAAGEFSYDVLESGAQRQFYNVSSP